MEHTVKYFTLTTVYCYAILTSKIKNGGKPMNVSTTKMSSKGQIVIPEDIRKQLGLSAGSQFIVIGSQDAVILKTIQPPSVKEVKPLLASARASARKAGAKKSDVSKAIKKARAKK